MYAMYGVAATAGALIRGNGFSSLRRSYKIVQRDNEVRTHLSLEKDAPVSRAVELAGRILCRPILGGLHHQYVRI